MIKIVIPFEKVKKLLEILLQIEHEQWSHHMKYISDNMYLMESDEKESYENAEYIKSVFTKKNNFMVNDFLVEKELWEQWIRRMNTPYSNLTAKESKYSERWAFETVKILANFLRDFNIIIETEERKISITKEKSVKCSKCGSKFIYIENIISPLDEKGYCSVCQKL